MAKEQTFIESCYKDKRGKVAVAQIPNLPIMVWAVSAVFARIFSNGSVHDLFVVVSFGALFTWAWMELFSGSNYLRRLLGLAILVLLIQSNVTKF
jgi:hypothetical protein